MVWFSLCAGLLALSACEQLRPLTWTQGAGEDLYSIADYNGKTFQARTGGKRYKGQTSRADELIVLSGFDKINNVDAVDLSFLDGLFANIDISDFIFYGRENHDYQFQYDLTDDYVVLSKVADRKDIPSQELTFAQPLGGGLFKVPVMGLPVALYTVEIVRDERGKDTRKKNTYLKDYLNQATHFKVRLDGIKYFDAPSKQDLFPADYFITDDEWFFTKTLVGRPINSSDILGSQLQSLKIKFSRTNNSIIGVDLNIAKEQEVLDPTKTITALEFPAEWVDFRMETSGANAFLKEIKLGDREVTSRFWRDRQYALVDFNNADRLGKAFTLDNKLERLEVGNDYLSFTIYESSTGNTYKYSLAKENRPLAGQNLFADDARLFHIFTEKRKVIAGTLYTQSPDIDRIIFANRFYPDPDKPEIVYHLSQGSPNTPEFVEAVRAAIQAWDVAFAEAGTGIRVRFEDDRVELGDVRYNQIVLYGYEIDSRMSSGGTLLGFGPSVQDTRTGQTFSAAVHIYLRAYREGLLDSIRSFVRNELGLYDNKMVSGVLAFASADLAMTLLGGGPGGTPGDAAGLSSVLAFVRGPNFDAIGDTRKSLESEIIPSDAARESLQAFERRVASGARKHEMDDCDFAAVAARSISWDKIRATCLAPGNPFAGYVERLRAAHGADPGILNLSGEEESVLACAQPLMKDLLISTLIHEVGHNLGLGHNFAASSDRENYAREGDASIAYPSSSVMDYPDRDFDLYSKVGPYDIATISFLYARKVQTKTGELITVPPDQSALESARKQRVELKRYRMCTDWEVDSNSNLPSFDPLCSRWDVGSSPVEYVQWAIRKIHADIIENGYRYNDVRFSGGIGALKYFSNFKQIHDYFRYLVLKQAGLFFEKMPELTEGALLEAIKQTSNPALTLSYYQAVKDIFVFSREIINLPSRVCLFEDGRGEVVDLVEFRDFRNRIFDKHQVTVQNCMEADPFARDILSDLGKASALLDGLRIRDRGTEINSLELDLDPSAASDMVKKQAFGSYETNPRYSSGMVAMKVAALSTLLGRADRIMAVTDVAGVKRVNFVDFPWYSKMLYEDGIYRVVQGINGPDIDSRLSARVPFYREYEEFNTSWLTNLFLAGYDQRSQSLAYSISMRPRKEQSPTVFDNKYGDSEAGMWTTQNTKYEILYASGNTIASMLIRLLNECKQVPVVDSIVARLESTNADAKLGEKLKAADASLATEDRLFKSAVSYCEGLGMNVQPAQKGLLRGALKKALEQPGEGQPKDDDPAKLLQPLLASFLRDTLQNKSMKFLYDHEYDNYNALINTLNAYLAIF